MASPLHPKSAGNVADHVLQLVAEQDMTLAGNV